MKFQCLQNITEITAAICIISGSVIKLNKYFDINYQGFEREHETELPSLCATQALISQNFTHLNQEKERMRVLTR
jgi:hypothetical protein